ncbi:uncharacterized protein LOC144108094 [Amblyomma americanum]
MEPSFVVFPLIRHFRERRRTAAFGTMTVRTSFRSGTVLLLFASLWVPHQAALTAAELQRQANEDCRSRQLRPGHSFVHWHAVANVTSYYYRCDYDTGVKTDCANGKRTDGSRDVVCQVLADGAVDPYEFRGRCQCTCTTGKNKTANDALLAANPTDQLRLINRAKHEPRQPGQEILLHH